MLAIRSAFGEIAENQTGLTGRIYQRWILSGLKKTRHVACGSETTREDVLRLTKLSLEKVSVASYGLNYKYRPMAKEEFLRHLQQLGLIKCKPFLLHIGGNSWYKNKGGLLRIFSHMIRLDENNTWNLVLAGDPLPEALVQFARELGVYDRIKNAINVTNEQLCALYSAAQGLFFPSLAEGFGWPIIEAQSCGCPVFASNRKPMTDVGGDGAVYFDPEDEIGAAEMINSSIKNTSRLIQWGFQNAATYTTEEMTSGYIAKYLRLLGCPV